MIFLNSKTPYGYSPRYQVRQQNILPRHKEMDKMRWSIKLHRLNTYGEFSYHFENKIIVKLD